MASQPRPRTRRAARLAVCASSSNGDSVLTQDVIRRSGFNGSLNGSSLNGSLSSSSLNGSSSQSGPRLDLDRAALHDVIEEEVHTAFEHEIEALNEAMHTAFEQEISTAKTSMKEALENALADGPKQRFNVTANVNTLMAVTAVISYWRGVGGLLDILLEDSLEGYIACTVFGLSIIALIRILKLPVVEGNGLGGF